MYASSLKFRLSCFSWSPLKVGCRPSVWSSFRRFAPSVLLSSPSAGRSSQRAGGHRPFQPGVMFHVGVRGLFLRRPGPVACGSRSDPGLNCIRTKVARLCCNASRGECCVVNLTRVFGQARVRVIVKSKERRMCKMTRCEHDMTNSRR